MIPTIEYTIIDYIESHDWYIQYKDKISIIVEAISYPDIVIEKLKLAGYTVNYNKLYGTIDVLK